MANNGSVNVNDPLSLYKPVSEGTSTLNEISETLKVIAQGGELSIPTPTATVDNETGIPEVFVRIDEGNKINFDFRKLKGETGPKGNDGEPGTPGAKGDKGDTGDAAGFGEITATITNTTGTPSVTVTPSGTNAAKSFAFSFSGLKGEKGDPGEGASIDTSTLAPKSHASSGTEYGIGDTSNYGHVKLNGSYANTATGVAATPAAVKQAYDIAVAANTTANNALPKAGGVITGSLTVSGLLQTNDIAINGNGNYGNKLSFGDAGYVHLYERTDDLLEIKASTIDFAVGSAANININGVRLNTMIPTETQMNAVRSLTSSSMNIGYNNTVYRGSALLIGNNNKVYGASTDRIFGVGNRTGTYGATIIGRENAISYKKAVFFVKSATTNSITLDTSTPYYSEDDVKRIFVVGKKPNVWVMCISQWWGVNQFTSGGFYGSTWPNVTNVNATTGLITFDSTASILGGSNASLCGETIIEAPEMSTDGSSINDDESSTSVSSAQDAVIIGSGNVIMHTQYTRNHIAIGHGLYVSNDAQCVVGHHNLVPTMKDRFTVGNGTFGYSSNGWVYGNRSNAFRVTYDAVYAKGSYNATGADYAEMFEWKDGNPNNEDRRGLFVTLDGDKLVLANKNEDYIIGVVSGNPSIIGDAHDDEWNKKFVQDVFGTLINENMVIPEHDEEYYDEDGEIKTRHVGERKISQLKLNEEYDGTSSYIPRSERPEWSPVGLMGKLVCVDDGTCQVNGWATTADGGIATNSAERTKYRVMKRLDDTHIQILIL